MYNILVCDDDKEIVEAIEIYLTQEGYRILKAYDGTEALEMLEREEVHLLLLDVMMPKLDGIRATLKIREKNSIPIIILSAKSEDADKILGLNVGADDYVTKPFVAKELIARIRAVTRRKSETESPNLAFENITLNRSTCELSSDKASVRLANKEYQMLEMFMSNPRQIISPDRFMEKIWGFDSDTEQNVVWVYISYLRKKLAKVGANVQIKAARNMGYSLEAKND